MDESNTEEARWLLSQQEEAATKEARLLRHMQFHKIKQWLLNGCQREDAQTIRNAVLAIPERRLRRRLARALCKGQ